MNSLREVFGKININQKIKELELMPDFAGSFEFKLNNDMQETVADWLIMYEENPSAAIASAKTMIYDNEANINADDYPLIWYDPDTKTLMSPEIKDRAEQFAGLLEATYNWESPKKELKKVYVEYGGSEEDAGELLYALNRMEHNASEGSHSSELYNAEEFEKYEAIMKTLVHKIAPHFVFDLDIEFPYEQWEENIEQKTEEGYWDDEEEV